MQTAARKGGCNPFLPFWLLFGRPFSLFLRFHMFAECG